MLSVSITMKRKTKRVFMRQCDWCGTDLQTNEPGSDSYVINQEHKIFCKIHTPGQEPFKDCLADYAEDRRKNVQEKIKKKQERLQPQKKVSVQEKEKVIKKFELKTLRNSRVETNTKRQKVAIRLCHLSEYRHLLFSLNIIPKFSISLLLLFHFIT